MVELPRGSSQGRGMEQAESEAFTDLRVKLDMRVQTKTLVTIIPISRAGDRQWEYGLLEESSERGWVRD